MLSDEELQELLVFEDLIDGYNKRSRQIQRDVKETYADKEDVLRQQKLTGLENERNHRDLLNLAVYPFTEQGLVCKQLGYRFYRGSPLYEIDVPNFDFLIARLEPPDKPVMLIAGEAKSSIGSPEAVIHEIQAATDAFNDNIEYVLGQYLNEPTDREVIFEPVAMVRSFDSSSMVSAVVGQNADIRVWHAPLAGDQQLTCAPVPDDIADPMNHQHHDPELRNLLADPVPSMKGAFNVWPKTHTLVQMGILITASEARDNSRVLTRHRLSTFLTQDMFYLDDDDREGVMDELIETGIEIGFLEPEEGHETYRLVSMGIRTELQQQTLHEKWIDWKLEQDLQAEIQTRLEDLENELKKEREKRRTLGDY